MSKRSADDLSRYVGKDAWIKVRLSNPFLYCFIRIEREEDDRYIFNMIETRRISRDGLCHCRQQYKDWKLKDTSVKSKYSIQPFIPLEVYTTDELFVVDGD